MSLEINSTLGLFVRENSLFGRLPYVNIVRRPGSRFCSLSLAESNASAKLNNLIESAGILTYPSDSLTFQKMARRAGTVLVCHVHWLGIRQMTLRISDHLDIPVMMVGDTTLSVSHVSIKDILDMMGVRKLHFQGIPPHSITFASYLRATTTSYASLDKFIYEWVVSISYHSGIAVHNVAYGESALLNNGMKAAARGDVLLTFLEHDQAVFSSRLGVPACAVSPTFVAHPEFVRHKSLKPSADLDVIRIGLLGTGTRHAVKNFFTQIGAACMFHGAELHVNSLTIPHLRAEHGTAWFMNHCGSRFVEHGVLDSETFRMELSTFDINFYVSWTDAVPNVVLDSLAAGVPVIVSDVTSIFKDSPKLKNLLVESRVDDPLAIYRRAVSVLKYVKQHRDEFQADVVDLFSNLRRKAFSSWQCFLNSTAVVKTCMNEADECVTY